MSKEERKVPDLRFKGFYDDWEQRELSKVSSISKGKFYSKKDLINEGNQIILYGQLYTNYTSEISFTNQFVHPKPGSIYSKGNEVIIPASGESSEDISIASSLTSQGIILGSDLNIVTPNNSLNNTFLALTLSHGNTKKRLSKYAQGKTVVHLHGSNFKKLSIKFPSIDEQKKIKDLICKVDNLVSLHRRKRNILQKLKQIYLMKMNPKKEKISPELYFSNCSRTWEQRKLSSIYNVTMGHSPKSENYTSNPEDYILVQGNADIKNGWVKPRVWTTQITSLVMAGSILLSVRAPVGNVGKTSYDVVIGRGIASIEGDEFIYQLLSKMHMENFWRKFSTGSTFESINSKDIKDALIKVPTNKEREKIGSFLEIIDSYIVHQNDTVDSLIKLKDSYLAKMFL